MKHPQQLRKVLLVANNEDKTSKKLLEKLYENASIYLLYPRDIKEDRSTGFYYTVHDADFNLTGILKNDKLMNLEKMQLDLLLDLSSETDHLKYITNRSKASLKVGDIKSDNAANYDLLVEFGRTNEETLEIINEHLTKLTKHAIEQV